MYTLVIVGTTELSEAILLEEALVKPPLGNGRLRFIHSAPTAGNVDIYLSGINDAIETLDPVPAGLAFKDDTGDLDMRIGVYRLRITEEGSIEPLIDVTVIINDGQYFLLAIAESNDEGEFSVLAW